MLRFIKRAFCARKPLDIDDLKENRLQRHFIDKVKLKVKAGDGGKGAFSFFTDKWTRKGPPEGGCGGRGGDIYFEASKSLLDLYHFKRKTIEGNHGDSGSNSGKDGKNGGKLVHRVPVGTLVYELKQTEEGEQKKLLGDLDVDKKILLIAKGGEAGKGNKRFPTLDASHRTGGQGQQKHIYLELKCLAQVGLVGLPNVGKSTLLAAITRALPKIANYEFTTLYPSIGIIKFIDDLQISVADIPGIIEDAHLNKGLGLEFLRHIQRTRILVFVIDATKPEPQKQIQVLWRELKQYDSKFQQRKWIVVLSKSDCMPNTSEIYNNLKSNLKVPCFMISAKHDIGLSDLVVCLRNLVLEQVQSPSPQPTKQAI